mgnify:CR=1 FL=1
MESSVNPEVVENNGSVNIADEVVAVIASMAASEVSGVASMVSGVAGNFAELIGMKNTSKGVKIAKEGDTVSLDLAIVVEYGAKIPDVSWNVQSKVKSDVEAMTGLSVSAVNVSVDSITAPAAEEKQEENKAEKAEEVSETDKEESVSEAANAAEE